jgi:phospholipid/cholesterol/gamma-HCH transport system permease protein
MIMDAAFTRSEDVLQVHMPLAGGAAQWLARPLADAIGMDPRMPVRTVRIDAPAQWRWDSADAAFLAQLVQYLEAQEGVAVTVADAPEDLEKLLALARQQPAAARSAAARPPGFAARVGLVAQARFASLKAFVDLIGAVQLRAFGVGIYVADLVGIAAVRELSPILTAVVLAGRTGASFAAHNATMQGNEEVDALTTMGVPPVQFLVVPRVVALGISMPLLYVYACVLSLLGGMLVATPLLDISPTAYIVQTREAIAGANFAIGALKALTFGAFVALIGCHYGLRAARSAAGVGEATTMTVVSSIVVIIVLDAVFAICANALDI